MTKLGEFFIKRAVNKALISRKTGLNPSRLSELSINPKAKLRADELYLIALAIESNPCELLEFVCGHLQLGNNGLARQD